MEDVVLMPLNAFLKARRGQSRILEAVIAAIIIFIVFSVSLYLIHASQTQVIQERADLDRVGYNVLHTLVESGTIEQTLEIKDNVTGPALLKATVQKTLPTGIYFNLTVYTCTGSLVGPSWFKPNPVNLTNAAADSFIKSAEVSSTSIPYTSKTGNIYYLVLVLARAGGG